MAIRNILPLVSTNAYLDESMKQSCRERPAAHSPASANSASPISPIPLGGRSNCRMHSDLCLGELRAWSQSLALGNTTSAPHRHPAGG
eukprot:3849896-Lingulodinium_polyedra.AAC.1